MVTNEITSKKLNMLPVKLSTKLLSYGRKEPAIWLAICWFLTMKIGEFVASAVLVLSRKSTKLMAVVVSCWV